MDTKYRNVLMEYLRKANIELAVHGGRKYTEQGLHKVIDAELKKGAGIFDWVMGERLSNSAAMRIFARELVNKYQHDCAESIAA